MIVGPGTTLPADVLESGRVFLNGTVMYFCCIYVERFVRWVEDRKRAFSSLEACLRRDIEGFLSSELRSLGVLLQSDCNSASKLMESGV
jgi:hypothetical protein